MWPGRPPGTCELEQRWRRCLASLLLFTIMLTNNFGVSSTRQAAGSVGYDRWSWMRSDVAAATAAAAAARSAAAPPKCLHSAGNGECVRRADSERSHATRSRLLRADRSTGGGGGGDLDEDVASGGGHCPAPSPLPSDTLLFCRDFGVRYLLNRTARARDGCSHELRDRHVQRLKVLDRNVGRLYESFRDVISRFDCQERYSVSYSCKECVAAYLQWLCLTHLQHQHPVSGLVLRPCRVVCHRVQLLCPYFLPSERADSNTQYAGEPSFICEDPMIQETSEMSFGSLYGPDQCCLHPCCAQPAPGWCPAGSCRRHSSQCHAPSTDSRRHSSGGSSELVLHHNPVRLHRHWRPGHRRSRHRRRHWGLAGMGAAAGGWHRTRTPRSHSPSHPHQHVDIIPPSRTSSAAADRCAIWTVGVCIMAVAVIVAHARPQRPPSL